MTLPAGSLYGLRPIVDSTAGWRFIHSMSCAQPGASRARKLIANVRLNNGCLRLGFEFEGCDDFNGYSEYFYIVRIAK